MLTAEFDFQLPPELIAQHPAPDRDGSRLLVLNRTSGQLAHRRFPDLAGLLRPGDLMVFNNSRVIPARLRGFKPETGGEFEILLLEEVDAGDWWVMLRPGKRVRPGTRLRFRTPQGTEAPLTAEVRAKNAEGHCRLRFSGTDNVIQSAHELGEMPLPPYISRSGPLAGSEDQTRYQTIYAASDGSVAAPTAGLHFTAAMLSELGRLGVETQFVTLHVGAGTFAPVKVDTIETHRMHEERFDVTAETAAAINRAKAEGRRVIAVGTTTTRVLEHLFAHFGEVRSGPGRTRIFIHPPMRFGVVDALLTNFHLPQSTLLMLVSAFAAPGEHPRGRDLVLSAYAEAVREHYRFFSYGDAMFLH